ncbi:MAG: PAS domain S-box protein [Cyanobacteria bacterium CRU_2_1]|nr:PAS domain S-box protein [Cyanobacteria bacterium CRU_2_1]
MSSTTYRRLAAYGVAIASTGIALVLSLWLQPLLQGAIGSFFYIAVIISTWYGGIRPGVVAIVLSILAINYFFIPPIHQLSISNSAEIVRLGVFLLVAFVINLLNSDLRHSKYRVEQLSQQLLQESGDRLQMALTAAQMGLWDWNMATGEIIWSPEHEQLFGLAPGTFDGRYETFDACLHPDDRDGLMQAIQTALQNHTLYQHEFRVIWADGSIHWIEGRGQALYDAADQPVRMSGTIMVINERKQTEAALQERKSLLRLFAQYAPAGIAMLDRNMRYVMASQRWVDEYCLDSVESLMGRSHYEIFPEIPERWRQIHQRCLIGAIEKCDDDLFVRADGRQQWISWEIRPWYTADNIGGIIIFTVDVTKRKQTELALMSREQYLRAIFEVEPECVKVITTDGILQTINPKGLAIVEADSVEQAIGQDIFPLIDPAYRQRFVAFTQAVANGNAGMLEFEGTGLKGTRRWLETHAVPLKLPGETTNQVLAVTRDITDRKRTETALRQSEERLRQILQDMPVMLDAFDEAWHIIAWNQECERVTGFSADEVIQNPTIMEQFYPNVAYREQMMAAWAEQGNNYRNWEWDIICKDGSTRTVSWSNISEQFPVSGWANWGIGMDVTDRKRAEANLRQLNAELEQRVAERTAELSETNDRLQQELEQRERTERALQESELKFHAMFDQSRLFIGLLQPDGTIFEVNQRPHELTERMGEVFVGRPFWELAIWGQGKQSQMRGVIERALAGEVVRLEMDIHAQDGSLLRMPDGSFVTHDIRVKAVKNAAGQVMFLTVEGWDISPLKQAEAAFKASEAKFRSLSESSPIGVFMANAEGQNVYTNPRAQEICGYSFEEALGEGWSRFVHPDDLQTLLNDWTSNALEQKGSVYEEVRYVRKDGTVRRYGRVQIVPILEADETPIAYMGTIEDITQQREIDQMKSEFISIVSHELRTPLTSMQAALSLLVEKIINPISEEGETIIQIASDGVDRLVRLVNDILDLERLESGKIRLEKRLCNTADLIAIAVDQMQEMANQASIALNVTSSAFEINADPDRLLQILINLLSNAIKFSEPRSTVWLTVEHSSTPYSPLPTPYILFTVKDQGRGIPANKLESIFERFQQVDASDSRKKGGTGLGLAICRSIVEQHGGRIWAESILDQGSSFCFIIPIS